MQTPRFRADDLAAASGLAPASIELLVKKKLAPPSEGKGRGSARIYTTAGLSHMIVVGALFSAGLELTPAARLGAAITGEFCSTRGYIPDNLDDLGLKLSCTNPQLLTGLPGRDNGDGTDRFALYSVIQANPANPNGLESGTFCNGDMFVEIINRRFVFFGRYDSLKEISPFSGKGNDVSVAYRIEGWERGTSGVKVIPIHNEMPPISPGLGPCTENELHAWKHAGAKIEDEFFAARRNAVSATRVNISLCIRNGFAAVMEHRNGWGAS